MSYLDEHDEIQKNIEESRFSETAEYLVNHFEYSNSVARNQSETSKSKLSGALVGILSDDQYQQTFVKYDENENIVLFKNIDNDPNSIILDISDNKAIRIPAGTTAQRPTTVRDGYMRVNTTTNYLEIYTNGNWGSLLKSDQAGAYIEGYVDTYIEDISRNINDRVTRDLSNVIGGASESLDTLLELENYVTDMSEGKIGKAITDILDISGRESQHYIILSNEIVDLSSETVRDITDLSSYTSSELSREISDLSSETVRDIIDLSNSTTTQLNTKQDTLTNGDVTNNLLANSSFTLGGVNINLGDTDNTPAFDLTDATNYPTSSLTGTIDLTNQVAGILPVANGGTSWQTKTNGLRYDSNIGIGIDPTSTIGLHCKQNDPKYVFEGTNDNKDSIIEIRNSSGSTTAWKLQNDAVNAPADSFRIMYYNGNALRIDNSTRNVNIGSSYNNTNPYKLNVEGTVNTEGKFTTTDICANDISANAMDLNNLNVDGIILNNVDINSTFQTISHVSIISQEIVDLSGYTSSELSREISDLSSETVRDVTDLSSYTSSELSREISDLSSETVRDITDLSSYTSSELSREISDLSSETVRDIIDLSSYTSNELTRQIVDLSNSTTTQLNIERNTTSTEISTVYSYTSSELHREITDLSSETVRDISDLSSLAFYTVAADVASIDTNISDSVSTLISHTLDKVSDLSNYTSTELSREISVERSTVVRDLSDMSGGIHHIIDDLIGNAPTYLDTLEEIAFVLGNPNDPSGGDLRTIIQKIYSVSQDIYDLSQTVAGVDSNFRILDGTLTVNTNLSEGETTAINAINGDISLNKTILFHNKGNIILGNASTGDTIKPLSYANMPLGNILIGSGTDISNSSIQYATGVGHSIDLSGTGSTALGYLAKTDGLNATAIGYNSVAFGDNVIQLGNTQVEYVNTNGVVTMSSDARLKANVKTIPNALEKVNALRGVTYTRTDLPNKDQVYMGLIAQETEKIIPEVVNNKGQYKSIMYSNLVGVLVEAVKDLDINHKILNGRQTTLETEITTIKDVIRTRLKKLNKIKNLIDVKDNKDKK